MAQKRIGNIHATVGCTPPDAMRSPKRAFLYTDPQDVSQRTVEMRRALLLERQWCASLAAPRQVEPLRSRVGNTTL
jgi:hypothetical protein